MHASTPVTLTEVVIDLLRKTETVEFATKAVLRYGDSRDYVHKRHLLKVGPIWLNYEKRASYDSDVEIGFIADLDPDQLKKPGENRALDPVQFRQVASFNKADSEKIREQIAKTLLRVGAWEELKL